MAKKWDQVIPQEITNKIRKDLLSRDAIYFFGDEGTKGSRRRTVRTSNKMRARGGNISPDGKRFYDANRKRWIRLERAILERKIFFIESNVTSRQLFEYIKEQENGFMMAIIPLLARYDPPTSDNRTLTNRLYWFTHHHKQGGVSRNFIDPFFHEVLKKIEIRLTQEIKRFAQKYG